MPDDELIDIERAVAAWLAAKMPLRGRGAQHVSTGAEIDPVLWAETADLGWLSLGLPESAGGAGFSLVEEAILFRELGRVVAPGPFLPTVLAAHMAMEAGDMGLALAIAQGEISVAFGTAAGSVSIGGQVTGPFTITHARGAELVLVCARSGAALLDASDLGIAEIDPVDGSVPTGVARAEEAPAVRYVAGPLTHDCGLVLAAAVGVGLSMGALGVGVAHAIERRQFGKPIGTFQAVKHPLAEAALRSDGAEAQMLYAAIAVRDGLPGASFEAAVAKWAADEAARLNAEAVVQVHGAMGFTAEAVPYRYVLRAHVLGRTLALREELLEEIMSV